MHWRNSNFQYLYFIFGACHTPIEAHRKCREAIEDRELALHESRNVEHAGEDARARQIRANVEQARAEIAFLYECKTKLEEAIGFEPTMDDYQGNQRSEWRLELEYRAENFLLTTGTVPADHFSTMRMHPDFPELLEKINVLRSALQRGELPELVAPAWKSLVQVELDQAPRLDARRAALGKAEKG